MNGSIEKAILAGGCFWGMQDLIRKRPGVLSTRVGYTGGDVPNATYRNHGTHAEAIEIVFDPEQTLLPRPARVLLPDPRPDDAEPSGQRRRDELPLGDLLPRRRAAARRRGHDRRRRGLRPVARQGGHRGRAGRAVLGGRARASGLPRAVSRTATPATSRARTGCSAQARAHARGLAQNLAEPAREGLGLAGVAELAAEEAAMVGGEHGRLLTEQLRGGHRRASGEPVE